MQEEKAKSIRKQPRFRGIFENGDGFSRRIKLHSYIIPNSTNIEKCLTDAENGTSCVSELERRLSEYLGGTSVVATNSGSSAMHMALKVVSERIYGTDALDSFGAEASSVYMPMSMQPVFENGELIGADGVINVPKAYADDTRMLRDECSGDAFKRCVCLPTDLSMTEAEQDKIIEIIHSCFDKISMDRGAF